MVDVVVEIVPELVLGKRVVRERLHRVRRRLEHVVLEARVERRPLDRNRKRTFVWIADNKTTLLFKIIYVQPFEVQKFEDLIFYSDSYNVTGQNTLYNE